MGANELHVDILHSVSNCHNQSVVVPLDVEYDAVVGNDAGVRILILHILGTRPLRRFSLREPGLQRARSIAAIGLSPAGFQIAQRHYLHAASLVPKWYQLKHFQPSTAHLCDPARRESITWRLAGVALPVPSVRVNGATLCELSLMMVNELINAGQLDRIKSRPTYNRWLKGK